MIGARLLAFVPLWVWAALGGGVVVSAGLWHLGAVHDAKTAGMASVQQQWDLQTAAATVAALKATAAARAEEQRRAAAQQEIVREATLAAEKAVAERLAADRAAVGLRQRVAALAARCGGSTGHTAAATPGAAASSPGDLLADVQGRIDAAAGQLADVADARGDAGQACERSYDALK